MSRHTQTGEEPTLVMRSVRVRPTRYRRHALVRVIGEELHTTGRRTGVVRIIGGEFDGPTAA